MPDQVDTDDFDFDFAAEAKAVEAPETPATPEPQTPAAPSPLFEKAKSAGLDLGDIQDESGLAEFLLSKYTEQQPYVQYGQQYLASQSAGSNPVSKDQAPGPEASEGGDEEQGFDLDGHFSGLWKANELSPQARWAIENGIVSLGAEGIYVPKQGFEQMALPIVNEVNEAHIAQKQQLGKLFEGNPYKAIYEAVLPAIKHELTREFQQLNQQSFQGYEQQNFIEKWKQDNASWLYQPGTQTLTPDGLKFAQAVDHFQNKYKITDPAELAELALLKTGINPQAAAAPAQQAAQPPAQAPAPNAAERPRGPDGKFLPAQAAPPAEEPKSKQESFLDKAKARAAAGSSQGGYEDSAHAVVANQGDLDSMFVNAYRQQLAAA